MQFSSRADAARIAARILASRPTAAEEVPGLIDRVAAALLRLDAPAEPAVEPQAEAARPRRTYTRRAETTVAEAQVWAAPPPPASSEPPPAPKLVRRAEVAPPAPQDTPPVFAVRRSTLRGIVKWFDGRTRRGGLRLPGCAGDVLVETAVLEAAGIARLYKGQEVEARLSEGGDAPKVSELSLPGGAPAFIVRPGVVRDRRAKPVVVELKRETPRRDAARAEAELLLSRPR